MLFLKSAEADSVTITKALVVMARLTLIISSSQGGYMTHSPTSQCDLTLLVFFLEVVVYLLSKAVGARER